MRIHTVGFPDCGLRSFGRSRRGFRSADFRSLCCRAALFAQSRPSHDYAFGVQSELRSRWPGQCRLGWSRRGLGCGSCIGVRRCTRRLLAVRAAGGSLCRLGNRRSLTTPFGAAHDSALRHDRARHSQLGHLFYSVRRLRQRCGRHHLCFAFRIPVSLSCRWRRCRRDVCRRFETRMELRLSSGAPEQLGHQGRRSGRSTRCRRISNACLNHALEVVQTHSPQSSRVASRKSARYLLRRLRSIPRMSLSLQW